MRPNIFGIPFGAAGLAQCWTTAADTGQTPIWPANALWIVSASAWLLTLVAYVRHHPRPGDVTSDLADPSGGPFLALAAVVPVAVGGQLTRYATVAGDIVVVVTVALTVAVGAWLLGLWVSSDIAPTHWHPGYYLPTVAGGLVGAAVTAGVGDHTLARVLFGYGVLSWATLTPIIATRIFTQPALAIALRPTLAITLAPPVVAGTAWFRINGGRIDAVASAIAGYAVLMALLQVRLSQYFAEVPFGPSWWSYSFPYTAAIAYGMRWMYAQHVLNRLWTYGLLAVATIGLTTLAVRTAVALTKGQFLPRAAHP